MGYPCLTEKQHLYRALKQNGRLMDRLKQKEKVIRQYKEERTTLRHRIKELEYQLKDAETP